MKNSKENTLEVKVNELFFQFNGINEPIFKTDKTGSILPMSVTGQVNVYLKIKTKGQLFEGKFYQCAGILKINPEKKGQTFYAKRIKKINA